MESHTRNISNTNIVAADLSARRGNVSNRKQKANKVLTFIQYDDIIIAERETEIFRKGYKNMKQFKIKTYKGVQPEIIEAENKTDAINQFKETMHFFFPYMELDDAFCNDTIEEVTD